MSSILFESRGEPLRIHCDALAEKMAIRLRPSGVDVKRLADARLDFRPMREAHPKDGSPVEQDFQIKVEWNTLYRVVFMRDDADSVPPRGRDHARQKVASLFRSGSCCPPVHWCDAPARCVGAEPIHAIVHHTCAFPPQKSASWGTRLRFFLGLSGE